MYRIVEGKKLEKTPAEFGAKAAGLDFLAKAGFRVPKFFLVGYETIAATFNKTVSFENIVQQWQTNFNILPNALWAVRSSASIEDGENKSYAGLFRTETNVSTLLLAEALKKIAESFLQISQYSYFQDKPFRYGIIIQEMIASEFSGIIFSKNPISYQTEGVLINLIPGLGESIVSGKEEAFTVEFNASKPTFYDENEIYNGIYFNKEIKKISLKGSEIKQKIQPFIKELFKGIKKLENHKLHPIDCEFAIADNKLYWLQIRPITHINSEELLRTWDNSNIGDNYPSLTLPLTVSFVKHTYNRAYSAMCRFLGMNKTKIEENAHLLANMADEINGSIYYNVTAWQQLLYQLPFGNKTSKLITEIWGTQPAIFPRVIAPPTLALYAKLFWNIIGSFINFQKHKNQYLQNFDNVFENYSKIKVEELDFDVIKKNYLILEHKLGETWIAPMLNGFFTMLLFSSLKFIFKKSRLNKEFPNFINDILYAQGDVVSVKIVNRLKEIFDTIRSDNELVEIFENINENEIQEKLKEKHYFLLELINKYIEDYGERCDEGELKMETVDYKESPQRFYKMLKTASKGKKQPNEEQNTFSYLKIINQFYKCNLLKKWFLKWLIKATINRMRDRENFRFIRTKTFSLARKYFRAFANSLYKNKKIAVKEDALYLQLNEILNAEKYENFFSKIEQRKKYYKQFETNEITTRYYETANGLIPAETIEKERINSSFKGNGCCSGVVKAQVRIITSETIHVGNFENQILIGKYFEPGWINLFAQAAGIISERGNLLSHTAILCREMGLPAIVGAKNILQNIEDGDFIQMNGATGEIIKL